MRHDVVAAGLERRRVRKSEGVTDLVRQDAVGGRALHQPPAVARHRVQTDGARREAATAASFELGGGLDPDDTTAGGAGYQPREARPVVGASGPEVDRGSEQARRQRRIWLEGDRPGERDVIRFGDRASHARLPKRSPRRRTRLRRPGVQQAHPGQTRGHNGPPTLRVVRGNERGADRCHPLVRPLANLLDQQHGPFRRVENRLRFQLLIA